MLNLHGCCATQEKVDNDVSAVSPDQLQAISRADEGGGTLEPALEASRMSACCFATHEKNRRLARFDW